jgi:hypothetical protein
MAQGGASFVIGINPEQILKESPEKTWAMAMFCPQKDPPLVVWTPD